MDSGIVTGSGPGLGKETSLYFAGRGSTVCAALLTDCTFTQPEHVARAIHRLSRPVGLGFATWWAQKPNSSTCSDGTCRTDSSRLYTSAGSFAMSRARPEPAPSWDSIPEEFGRDLPGRGRSVLVTGSSAGIGLETCLHLARKGFHVYATMRDLARSGVLRSQAERAGVPLCVLRLDVTEEETVRTAVQRIVEARGPFYGVVNNAGAIVRGFFEDLEEEEIRRIFETNFFGALAVTRAVLPGMRRAGRGRIVMIGSAGGRFGMAGATAYCATKFALAGFSESLAQEVAPFGIQVVLIEPGMVRTELFGRNLGVARNARSAGSPYAETFESLLTLSLERSRKARLKALDVAEVVGRALLSARPPMRIMVGRTPRLVSLLKRYLPEEVFQRAFTWAVYRKLRSVGKNKSAYP